MHTRRSLLAPNLRHPAALIALSVTLFAASAFAQSNTEDGLPAVSVEHHGPLHAAIGLASTRLGYGTFDQQTVSTSKSNWFVRHPVITGTLIGTGAGLALSQVDSIGSVNHDPRVGVLGAAIGAWSGLIASALQKARAGQKVGAGTKIGIAAGAVSLIVLPVLAIHSAGG